MSYFNLGDGATNFDPELQFDNDIDKQMTNKELADEAARLVTNYETFLCEHIDAWREFCRKNREKIAAALRASAVAEPVGYRWRTDDEPGWRAGPNKLRDDDLAREDAGFVEEPLYAHPAPATPVPDQCAKCGQPRKEHTYNGACYGVCGEFVSATAYLPAPEAATMREEIIEQCAKVARGDYQDRTFYERGRHAAADAILALKAAPATINRI